MEQSDDLISCQLCCGVTTHSSGRSVQNVHDRSVLRLPPAAAAPCTSAADSAAADCV